MLAEVLPIAATSCAPRITRGAAVRCGEAPSFGAKLIAP
jgi:hypothetical protein